MSQSGRGLVCRSYWSSWTIAPRSVILKICEINVLTYKEQSNYLDSYFAVLSALLTFMADVPGMGFVCVLCRQLGALL